jgi:AP endonuclease-2
MLLIFDQFVDVFRVFHPDRMSAYTCWNTMTGARYSNYGSRIDYILADSALVEKEFFTQCNIRPDIHCSDHCNVTLNILYCLGMCIVNTHIVLMLSIVHNFISLRSS